MKNTFWFSILLSSLCISCSPLTPTIIQTSDPVNKSLFGFNNDRAYCFCCIERDPGQSLCKTEFNALQPQIFRFPGGNEANYYMPAPQTGIWNFSIDPLDKNIINTCPELLTNSSEPFISLVGGADIKVLFVANVLSEDYAAVQTALQHLLNNGVDVVGIELGNEMYLRKYNMPVSEYLSIAETWATDLKSDFSSYDLKIGVCVAPPTNLGWFPTELTKEYADWNKAVSKKHFYDAVIVHYYTRHAACVSTSTSPIPLENAWDCLKSDFTGNLPGAINLYTTNFPGKKIWLTEWNTWDEMYKDFGHKQVHNLYYARVLNHVSTNYNHDVDFMIYHNWLGGGDLYPVISPVVDITTDMVTIYDRKAPFFVFNILKVLFQDEVWVATNSPVFTISPSGADVVTYSYLKRKNGNDISLIYVIINQGSTLVDININKSKAEWQSVIYTFDPAELKCASAATLDVDESGLVNTTQLITSPSFQLSGYSVNVLEIPTH